MGVKTEYFSKSISLYCGLRWNIMQFIGIYRSEYNGNKIRLKYYIECMIGNIDSKCA